MNKQTDMTLAYRLMDKLDKYAHNGLPSVYDNWEDYMYDMYPDLPWNEPEQHASVRYILAHERMPPIFELILKQGFDLKREFEECVGETPPTPDEPPARSPEDASHHAHEASRRAEEASEAAKQQDEDPSTPNRTRREAHAAAARAHAAADDAHGEATATHEGAAEASRQEARDHSDRADHHADAAATEAEAAAAPDPLSVTE